MLPSPIADFSTGTSVVAANSALRAARSRVSCSLTHNRQNDILLKVLPEGFLSNHPGNGSRLWKLRELENPRLQGV